MLAADVSGDVSFVVFGMWSHGRDSRGYVDDVLRSLDAFSDVIQSRPTIILGDMNSGTTLDGLVSKHHTGLIEAFSDLGLVSAYHASHGIELGHEKHATYRHRFKNVDPWHIDFCFGPKGWADHITNAELLDDERWRVESDHHPLVVDLTLPA